jgi:hypothetical protein
MKLCPYCNAELRDSVIKCTHCGRSLRDAPEPGTTGPVESPPGTRTPSPSARPERGNSRPSEAHTPSPWAPPREDKLGWWTPNPRGSEPPPGEPRTEAEILERETRESAPMTRVETQPRPAWTGRPDAWATPEAPAPTPGREAPRVVQDESPLELPDLRALPAERRSGARPHFLLIFAGLAAIGAAVVAWQAVAEPWVALRITDTSERLDPVFVGDMVIRGKGAIVGTIGHIVAGVIGALGVMWFLFGFDRGWTMPWFASPAAAIVAAVGGIGATVLSSTVWFVWEDAAVERARAVGNTPEKLQELLNLQPAPLVEIARQPGLVRFGAMMALALVAAGVAMAAANKRS